MFTDINPNSPQIDRSAPYPVQMQGVAGAIQSFLSTRRASIQLPVTFNQNGIMEFTDKYVMHTYTRADLLTHLRVAHLSCLEYGVKDYERLVPEFTSTAKHFANSLTHTYTVAKGANEGQVRNLMMHALGAARRSIKREEAAETLAETVGNGDAWYADGVNDKNGSPRAYVKEIKARNAWCRLPMLDKNGEKTDVLSKRKSGGYGDSWYDCDKSVKKARQDEAVVYEQADIVGKMTSTGQASQAVNQYTSRVLATMPAITVKRLATKAGAPSSVTDGKGSKARCLAWFGEDVKRLASINTQ